MCGHPKTACLGLRNYSTLCAFDWVFCYSRYVTSDGAPTDDAALRTFAEQVWRAKHGWPVLCSR